MKKKLFTLSACFMSLGLVFAQSNLPNLPKKHAAPEKPALEGSKKNDDAAPVGLKGGAVWANDFGNAAEWVAAGPAGTNPPEFGWSVQSAINSWYNGFQANMNTTGTFAHFKNGTTTTAFAGGPFTFTYTGSFDLTGVPVPHLEFDQYGARFITEQAVQISLDNGVNWITVMDNFDLAPLTAGGGSIYPRPQLRRKNIAPFLTGDISNVQIRLYWDGAMNGPNMNYIDYGWYVDNIRIVPGSDNDLTINRRFAAVNGALGYMSTKIPASQVPSDNSLNLSFSADITNNGTQTQNAFLNASQGAYSGDGAPVALISLEEGTVTVEAANAFTIPNTPGTFNFTLTVQSDNTLENTGDDTATFPFEVTPANNGVMANDFYNGQTSSLSGSFTGWQDPDGDPSIGTVYEVHSTVSGAFSIGAVDIGIANISAGSQADYIGNAVFAQIWRYNPTSEEFEFLAISEEATIAAGNFGQILRVLFEECVSVNAGDDILVMASFSEVAEVPIAFAGESLAGTTIGQDGGTFVTLISTTPDGPFVRVPVVRPVFNCFVGIDETTINQSSVSTFPNPADDYANLSIVMNESEEVQISVVDLSGKVVNTINAGQLSQGSHTIELNTGSLAQGIYTIRIVAGASVVSQKLIIE